MKPRLSPAQQQHLVLTPQLRQAIRLLQLSGAELDAEIAEAVASNPLLEWSDEAQDGPALPSTPATAAQADDADAGPADPTADAHGPADEAWERDAEPWREGRTGGHDEPPEQPDSEDSLQDHLLWQLHLGHFNPRDARIGIALIDAIDDDGYLREDLDALVASLRPELQADPADVLQVLHRIQQFDPVGVGARDLGECLRLQLRALPSDTPGRAAALRLTEGALEKLPKIGIAGVAAQLGCPREEAETAVQLLRTLDPRPGAQHGALPAGSYVVPDCVIARRNGLWEVALSSGAQPRVCIQRGYEQMIRHAREDDAEYLRGRLQEARWLLKGLESRADTLLRVVRCLVREQAGFLEFGAQALRPLTLRQVAEELGLHESTVSRATARKYVRTPRGTLALRDFFASGIETDDGGSASSTAIQDMIRRLVAAEDPRKPLSDARLADTLKQDGVPVARRTVAKYREALQIPASHERVRIG